MVEGINNSVGKFFSIPEEPHDYDFLKVVDKRSKIEVNSMYGCAIDYEWQTNTICKGMIEALIARLGELFRKNLETPEPKLGVGIDFYGLFSAIASIKKDEGAEKQGNINISFKPGKAAIDAIENRTMTKVKASEVFTVEDELDRSFNQKLDAYARYNLSMNNGIVFVSETEYLVTAIAHTFIVNIFRHLYDTIVENEKDGDSNGFASVNFNDLIEFHASKEDGEIHYGMRPGIFAKLGIKSDEATEDTMGSF